MGQCSRFAQQRLCFSVHSTRYTMFSLLTKILLIALAIISILIVLGTHTLQYADPEDLRALAFSILPMAVKTSTDASAGTQSNPTSLGDPVIEGMGTDQNEPNKESVHAADPASDMKTSSKGSFCTSTPNDKSELERKCGKLTKGNCKTMDCCVLLNGAKCVTGDEHGPTFASDHKSDKPGDDYWYYKGDCYGNTCPKT
jgi:hypothetical protein